MEQLNYILEANIQSNRIASKLTQLLRNSLASPEYRGNIPEVETFKEIEDALTLAEGKLDSIHRQAREPLSRAEGK